MYLATVRWAMAGPSLRSSPWMRGAPQNGLVRLIWPIRWMGSGAMVFRPDLRGQTNMVAGIVTCYGGFWVEHIPLLGKRNLLSLIAIDAAGNSTTSNLPVIRSDTPLTIDSVPPAQWSGRCRF